jgi:hypothetical protein
MDNLRDTCPEQTHWEHLHRHPEQPFCHLCPHRNPWYNRGKSFPKPGDEIWEIPDDDKAEPAQSSQHDPGSTPAPTIIKAEPNTGHSLVLYKGAGQAFLNERKKAKEPERPHVGTPYGMTTNPTKAERKKMASAYNVQHRKIRLSLWTRVCERVGGKNGTEISAQKFRLWNDGKSLSERFHLKQRYSGDYTIYVRS